MGGRGRGRGRGLSINIEALGLGRGDVLPPVAHPPPLFPPLPFKPVSLPQSEEVEYMLALKQELTESFRKSPFHIKAQNKSKDIDRYSDKYQVGIADSASALNPDWSRLPAELREKPKRKRTATGIRPNLKTARRVKDSEVASLLEKLEKNDVPENVEDADADDDEETEKKKKKDEEVEEEDDEEYDDEDLEEETDYNLAYFDNGEGYGDDDEDDDEGPTY
ncbi:DNA-directed RNA polymerase III subunit RPC7-like [Aplysia californica]|uniref:DNA-directed RNA polymerase III subunit n=1 Tax=Aplysia californica TaxID=6500 RepID=A0ABM0JV84_APLCA|nr:DNA-directed RNA polymerase III subunit RPC7-like [Aplysia californica]